MSKRSKKCNESNQKIDNISDIICDINKAIEVLNETPRVPECKIYLNSYQVRYKEYLEREGFDVIIVDDLSDNISILYGNLDNKEK